MAKKERVTITTGSAFHALGRPDAGDLVLRAALMSQVATIIGKSGLSQSAAGRLIGMEQPRVSALLKGKISLFSTDRLVAVLNALGHDVEVRIRPGKAKRGATFVTA